VTEEKLWSRSVLQEWYRNPAAIDISGADGNSASEKKAAPTPGSPFMLRAMIRRDLRSYSDYMDQIIAGSRRPYPLRGPEPKEPSGDVPSILAPTFSPVLVRDANDRAQNALLALALALQAYKEEHKGYPSSLSELVPGYLKVVPTDPFTLGKTPGYRQQGDAYVQYSVGPDLKDDGGRPIYDRRKAPSENPRTPYYVTLECKGDIVAGVNP
jgi:type II secretory pathway pseudopilin PulG